MPGHLLYVILNFWFVMRNCVPAVWQERICASGLLHSPVNRKRFYSRYKVNHIHTISAAETTQYLSDECIHASSWIKYFISFLPKSLYTKMYCFIVTRVLVSTSFMHQSFSVFECNLNWLEYLTSRFHYFEIKVIYHYHWWWWWWWWWWMKSFQTSFRGLRWISPLHSLTGQINFKQKHQTLREILPTRWYTDISRE